MGAVQRIHDPDAFSVDAMAVISTLLGEHRVMRPQTRQAISQTAPPPSWKGSKDNATAAMVKTMKPRLYIRTRPYMSPRRPKGTTRTAVTTRYPISIHSR